MTIDDTGATFYAGTIKVGHHGGSMNLEGGSEFFDGDASFMHEDELGNLLVGQAGLLLGDRWDGSMDGRSRP